MFLSRPVIRALRRFGRFFLEVSRVRRALDLAANSTGELLDGAETFMLANET